MKILDLIMLLIQYAYYVMREEDRRWGRPVRFTRIRTFSVLGIVEFWMLVVCYLIITRTFLGHRIPKVPLSFSPTSVISAFVGGLVVLHINKKILGCDSRIKRYGEIFDAWDKGKRMRWKILLILIAVLSLAAFFFVGELSQNGLEPQNWKY